MGLWDYLLENREDIAFDATQQIILVVQCIAFGAIIAVGVASMIYRSRRVTNLATASSTIGLTIPSIALLGFLVTFLGFGVLPTVIALTFYAALPILRNAVVGLAGVDSAVVESARGMGMSRLRTLSAIELPMAWPVILAGIRVSTQLVMGIAAIAAYVEGPGLGGLIFGGLARLDAANALNDILIGTIGIVVLAIILDAMLVLIGRLTIPRGIRG